jgi:hypothetical protein
VSEWLVGFVEQHHWKIKDSPCPFLYQDPYHSYCHSHYSIKEQYYSLSFSLALPVNGLQEKTISECDDTICEMLIDG